MSFTFGSSTPKTTTGFTLGSSSATTVGAGAGGDVKAPTLSFAPQNTQVSFQQKATGTITPLNTFSLGTASTQGTGFSLGQTQSTPSTQPTGFSLGQTPAASGFSLGQTPSAGFSLGQSQSTTGFQLGQTPTTQSTGFSLGQSSAQSTGFSLGQTPSTGFSLGQTTGFSLGQTPSTQPASISIGQTPTTQTSGFSLGQTPSSQTGLSLGQTTTGFSVNQTTAQPAGFSLGSSAATTTTSSTGISFGSLVTPQTGQPSVTSATSASQAASPGSYSFGATAAASKSLFSTPAATTTTSVLKHGLQTPSASLTTTTASPLILPTSSIAPSGTTAATTVSPSSVPAPLSAINFGQLQESVNKWKVDLEDQEKLFMEQATQVNAWDHLLVNNSEKIVSLNNEVVSMKLQQQQLDHELDFILSQQGELEECLSAVEKDLASLPLNIDPERENIYVKAECMDSQLKQMAEDLKEIIEQLNETNRIQDTSDPIVQIGRILNAHMNSLQWIDQSTANIQAQLDSVTKQYHRQHRDSNRSYRLQYD